MGITEEERKANIEEKAGLPEALPIEILFTMTAEFALLHLLTNRRSVSNWPVFHHRNGLLHGANSFPGVGWAVVILGPVARLCAPKSLRAARGKWLAAACRNYCSRARCAQARQSRAGKNGPQGSMDLLGWAFLMPASIRLTDSDCLRD